MENIFKPTIRIYLKNKFNLLFKRKTKLFLITCSDKDEPCSKNFNNKSLSFYEELKNDRDFMMSVLKSPTTQHTRIIKNDIPNNINCKINEKAHVLYNGSFYKDAKAKCWTENQASKVYIMSALYGIIRADDYIIKYDLMMTDTLSTYYYNNGKCFTPQEFWKGKLDIILKKIKTDKNTKIYNLLADEDYNTVIKDKKIIIRKKMDKEKLKSWFTEQINKVK